MSVSRHLLPSLAVLLTAAALVTEAHAARPREIAPSPPAAATTPAKPALAPRTTAKTATTPKQAATDKSGKPTSKPAAKPSLGGSETPAATTKPDSAATTDRPNKPVLAATDHRARARSRHVTHPRGGPAGREASPKPEPRAGAKPLRPRREPLLARHPAATCALDPLEAVGLRQHGRARDSLREFYWSDMARFFESSLDLAEPTPTQVADPAFLATDAVLGDLPAAVRAPLTAVASARVIDRLGEREFNKVSKLLASLGPAQVASLLRADAPTLRGYVWSWLATTKTGGCHLGHLDLDFIEAAVGDRSVAVEHGDDLVYRSLGDYALAARARLATLDPQRFDTFLGRLTGAGEIDPLVRATAHGMLLRRAHWDTLETGLRDPSPPVRAATALGALEMNRDKVEQTIVEHAAGDSADLVTELIVGDLLGAHDPHVRGRAQLRGPLASTRDDRLLAAIHRWSGRGDPLEPLPGPQRPLRFNPGPVPTDMPKAPAASEPATQPAPKDSPTEPVPTASRPILSDSRPVRTDSEPPAPTPATEPTPAPTPASEPASEPRASRLPGVLDEPDEPALPGPGRDRTR